MQFRTVLPLLGQAVRHGPWPVRPIAVSAAALGACVALTGAAPAAKGIDVSVTVTNIRAAKGSVRGCITPDKKAFPDCGKDDRSQEVVVSADGKTAKMTFRNVAPGTYAISLLHDENDNDKMDTAIGMMPKEGYGFSRDAKVSMGPPKFKNAAFEVADKPLTQTIKMRYFL